jgi:ligand-binding sensor domain-containing protein
MNRLRNIAVLLCLSFGIAFSAYSQYKFEKAVILTKENGLPTNEIRSVRKGDDGFIWMTTSKGLCRFDGSQVKVYQDGDDLRYSLFDNITESVLPVKEHISRFLEKKV